MITAYLHRLCTRAIYFAIGQRAKPVSAPSTGRSWGLFVLFWTVSPFPHISCCGSTAEVYETLSNNIKHIWSVKTRIQRSRNAHMNVLCNNNNILRIQLHYINHPLWAQKLCKIVTGMAQWYSRWPSAFWAKAIYLALQKIAHQLTLLTRRDRVGLVLMILRWQKSGTSAELTDSISQAVRNEMVNYIVIVSVGLLLCYQQCRQKSL